MPKSSRGTIVVLNAFYFFHFKSLADGRIKGLAVSEAFAGDGHASFLGGAWLKAVLSV